MQKRIKIFRNSNIIHFFINSIIGACHVIIYLKLFWISNNAKNIFYYMIIIIFAFGIIPIILAIFVTFKKLTKNIMDKIKLLIKYFTLLEILKCIISSICLSENQRELSIFYFSCPFNYEVNDIDKIFDFYNSENIIDIQEKCQKRRCFFNEKSDDLNDIYLCNFNYKIKKKQCSFFEGGIISNKLINYFYYCQNFVTFYKCQKPEKEVKKSINSYDYICPNQIEEIINIILLYTFLIIDIIFLCTPWLLETVFIDDIISCFYNGDNINAQNNNSLKETNNTSQEQNDNEGNNNNFQRQQTEIIIVDKSEININNIINHKNDILNINKQKINSGEKKEKNINNFENNQSKSNIQLMQKQENHILKIFNKNKLYKEAKK